MIKLTVQFEPSNSATICAKESVTYRHGPYNDYTTSGRENILLLTHR
jgi:hypothetical protein